MSHTTSSAARLQTRKLYQSTNSTNNTARLNTTSPRNLMLPNYTLGTDGNP